MGRITVLKDPSDKDFPNVVNDYQGKAHLDISTDCNDDNGLHLDMMF